jgi:hypothetical protein
VGSAMPRNWSRLIQCLPVIAVVCMSCKEGPGRSGRRVDASGVDDAAMIPSAADGPASSGVAEVGKDVRSSPVADASISQSSREVGSRDAFAGERSRLAVDPPDGGMPACIWRLLRECCGGPNEQCLEESTDGGLVYNCWPTGETVVANQRSGAATGFRSDGTVCYKGVPTKVGGTDPGMAFYDGLGQEVATVRFVEPSPNAEVYCDGAVFVAKFPFTCHLAVGNCRVGRCGM